MKTRLLEIQPDGFYEIVGYEIQKDGKIFHQPINDDPESKPFPFFDILQTDYIGNHFYYISHDRRDRCIGKRKHNGLKEELFERDILIDGKKQKGVIFYCETSFGFYVNWHLVDGSYQTDQHFSKVVGVEGVEGVKPKSKKEGK